MSGAHRTGRKGRRRAALWQVLLVLTLALGALPLLAGSTLAVGSDLSFSKSGPATVAEGGTVTYTISIHNNSTVHSQPVSVSDNVDANLTNVQASATQGSCSVNGNSVSCSLGQIAAGGSASVTISATAPTGNCPTISNFAKVNEGSLPPLPTNTVVTQVTGCTPNVTFSKSGPATVAQGGTVTYTIGVQNSGTVASDPVTVTDSVDPSLTNVQASASQGSCSVNGNSVSCSLGPIAAGGSASVTISATAPTGICPTITNTAEIQQGNQPPQSTNTVTTTVTGCTPNVTFSKSGPATVAQGGTVTYTIGVQNSGTVASDPVTVTDSVDPSLTNVQASASQGSCSVNGNSVSCSLGPIAAGGSASVTISATAPTGICPTITNTAEIQQGNQPPQSTNTVTTTVTGCTPNVTFSKSGPATVAQGGTVTYTIGVQNSGTVASDPVTVTDSVDPSLTNVQASASQGSCSVNGNSVSCSLGPIAAGGSASVTISATAPTGICPTITNTAEIQQGNQPPQSTNTVTTTVTGCTPNTPNVGITKRASAAAVAVGGSFSYTVVVSNTGTGDAQNVVVTDSVPAGLTITNVTGPGCSTNGQNVTCNVGTLAAGASATITITVTATAQSCPSVVNSAHVTWSDGQANASATSNQVVVAVACTPGVGITKTASAAAVAVGGSFSYTVVVSNTGTGDAQNVVVTDSVPAGLTITNVTGPGCSTNGQNVTCNVGTLAAGASATITITVTATAQSCPSVVNSAHVTWSDGQANASATSNQVVVGVNCQPDVQIVKNADAPARGIDSGDSFTYTITVSNDGTATAEGVVVTDTIPDGLTIDDVNGPGCSVHNQAVTCNVGSLAAGASATITITVTATDDACPDVENFAHVEWNEGEETASEDSNVVHTDVECIGGETVTPTPPPSGTTTTPPDGTAFTGPDEGAVRMGLSAIALLVLGTGLLFAGYRRRARPEA